MSPDFVQFASGALVAAVIVGLAWLATNERARRVTETKERQLIEARLSTLQAQVSAFERAGNPLYREAIEDQRARQLNAADSVAVGVEHMLNAIRILAPEMLKKGKR